MAETGKNSWLDGLRKVRGPLVSSGSAELIASENAGVPSPWFISLVVRAPGA